MISNRQRIILKHLLQQNDYCSSRNLAEICSVTERSIRNDMNYLSATVFSGIIEHGREGYFIPKQYRLMIKEVLSDNSRSDLIPDTASMRQLYVLMRLFAAENPISMQMLSDEIYVSKSTIAYDVRKATELAEKSGVMIVSSHQGLKIESREKDRFHFFSTFIFSLDESHLPYAEKLLRELTGFLNDDYIWLYEYLVRSFDHNEIRVTDRGLHLYTLIILYGIYRFKNGHRIESEENNDLKYFDEKEINNRFECNMDESEAAFLCRMVRVYRIGDVLEGEEDETADEITDTYISMLASRISLSRENIMKYRESLRHHIRSMLYRLRNNVHFENDNKQIKQMYPYAFECSTMIIPIVQSRTRMMINESELIYLTIYTELLLESERKKINTVVLCGAGVSMSFLINEKLEKYFSGQLNILGFYPAYQLDSVLVKHPGIDLLLTTSIIEKEIDVPVILISPFMGKEDIERIQMYLDMKEEAGEGSDISAFMSDELFEVFDEEVSQEEIIELFAQRLEKLGYIYDKEGFIESVWNREKLYSTQTGFIWFPHPTESYAVKTMCAIAICRSNQDIRLVMLFSVLPEELENFRVIYNKIGLLIENENAQQRLLRCKRLSDFIDVLNYL